MAFHRSRSKMASVFSPRLAGAVCEAGDFRLFGTWTAGLAVIAFVGARRMLPRTIPAAGAEHATVRGVSRRAVDRGLRYSLGNGWTLAASSKTVHSPVAGSNAMTSSDLTRRGSEPRV